MATPCKKLQKAAKKRVFCAANVSLAEPITYDILMNFGAPRASLKIARIATFSYSAPTAPIVFLTPRPASILVLSVFFFGHKARERPLYFTNWRRGAPIVLHSYYHMTKPKVAKITTQSHPRFGQSAGGARPTRHLGELSRVIAG
jgi:hypothetical protein